MSVVVMWNETYVILTGCVVFLVCGILSQLFFSQSFSILKMVNFFNSGKLLQLMDFNRATRIFVAILKQSLAAMMAFLLMFSIILFAFSMAGNLLFGRHLQKFSTIVNSLQECGSMVMG